MSEAIFTPGPWFIEDDELCRHGFRSISSRCHTALADVVWQMENDEALRKPSPSCEANAHLVAAAPELYYALEAMLAEFNEQIPGVVHDEIAAISKARAALAKARGES